MITGQVTLPDKTGSSPLLTRWQSERGPAIFSSPVSSDRRTGRDLVHYLPDGSLREDQLSSVPQSAMIGGQLITGQVALPDRRGPSPLLTRLQSERRPDIFSSPVSSDRRTVDHRPGSITRQDGTHFITYQMAV